MTSDMVEQIAQHTADLIAKKKAIKNGKRALEKAAVKTTMKWEPFLSTFVLNKMCEIIKSGVRTEKGFKEVHLNNVAKKVFELCGIEVSST